MLYTLTTNPAIDMNIESKKINPSVVNRTESSTFSENGKGVNVSLILKHYGIDSKVLGFFGGFSGEFIINQLNNKAIETIPIKVEEPTRINIFINDGKEEYKIVNRGSFVPKEKQLAFLGLLKTLDDCKYLVISGSLPEGINEDYYQKILEICKKKSIEVILDISSRKLKELVKYKPLLIKPNDEEVRKIFGFKTDNEADVKVALRKLHQFGAKNILLTLGEKGLYFYNGTKMLYCNAPKIKLCSSACAGDSALAAFLSEWIYGNNLELALKKSSATGANVAESEGRGNLGKVEQYIKKLIVREV